MARLSEGVGRTSGYSDGEVIIVGPMPTDLREVMPRAVADFKSKNSMLGMRIVTGSNASLPKSVRLENLSFVIGRLHEP